MSWLSKALGLDKKPKLLKEINKVGNEALAAGAASLQRLAEDRNWDAFVHRLRLEVKAIQNAKTVEVKTHLINELQDVLEKIK